MTYFLSVYALFFILILFADFGWCCWWGGGDHHLRPIFRRWHALIRHRLSVYKFTKSDNLHNTHSCLYSDASFQDTRIVCCRDIGILLVFFFACFFLRVTILFFIWLFGIPCVFPRWFYTWLMWISFIFTLKPYNILAGILWYSMLCHAMFFLFFLFFLRCKGAIRHV